MPARRSAPTPVADVPGTFQEWLALKAQVDLIKKRQEELRLRLAATIERDGYADDKGNLFIDLEEEIEGYAALKYERRVSKTLDEDRAETLIKQHNLEDRCIVMVPEIDQEELLKAHYDGILSQEELDDIFDVRETFAFVPKKA